LSVKRRRIIESEPDTGKSVTAPGMTYDEWKEKHVGNSGKDKEYNVIREIKGRPNKYVVDKISSGAYGAKLTKKSKNRIWNRQQGKERVICLIP